MATICYLVALGQHSPPPQEGYYGRDCTRCNCGPAAYDGTCDVSTGQCDCPDNYQDRQCTVCADGFYGDNCDACGCVGSDPVCDKESGQCDCSSFSFYLDPRTCERCPDQHRLVET
eukprot:sb/3476641/